MHTVELYAQVRRQVMVEGTSQRATVSSGVKSGHVRISRSGVKSGQPVVISLKNPRREVSFHAS